MYLKCLLLSEEARAWDVPAEVRCQSSKKKTVFMYLFNVCVGGFMSKSADTFRSQFFHPAGLGRQLTTLDLVASAFNRWAMLPVPFLPPIYPQDRSARPWAKQIKSKRNINTKEVSLKQ